MGGERGVQPVAKPTISDRAVLSHWEPETRGGEIIAEPSGFFKVLSLSGGN